MDSPGRIVGAALLALLLGAANARADVTAAEVWQEMYDLYAVMGRKLSVAGKTHEGDTLVITGASFGAPREAGVLQLEVPELRLREMGDGRVEITVADRMTATVTSPGSGRFAAGTRLDVSKTAVKVIVSGMRGDMTFDFDVAEVTIATAEAQVAGRKLPARFALVLADGKGKSRIAGSTTRTSDTEAGFDSVRFDVTGVGDEGAAGPFHATGTLNGVQFTSGLQLPAGISPDDMTAALAAGYRMEGRLRFASGNVNADVKEATGATNVQAGFADGEVTAALGRDGMSYALGAGPARAVVQLPALPVPAETGIEETRLAFSMPAVSGEGAKPFSALLNLSGLTMSEGIWAIFDPAATLPRDPMRAVFDLSGRMRLMGSLYGEAVTEDGKLPAEVEEVSLNELQLSALGAKVSGKGAATFGGTEPPLPVGSAEFDISGVNGLIDKLNGMGLLPQEQAMGLRMSLALFTVPTGEDSAKTSVEADAEGNVRVNGQVLYKFPKP